MGDSQKSISFEVDVVRDGGSFCTRRVMAKQDEVTIYHCSLSFGVASEGVSHQQPMEPAVGPEGLMTDTDFHEAMRKQYPGKYNPYESPYYDWDIRRLKNFDPFTPEIVAGKRASWVRYIPPIEPEQALNRALLAYISDMGLVATAYLPHGFTFYNNKAQTASLNHAMWFHAPCHVNDWIYSTAESHWAGDGRSLNIGKLFRHDGVLLATTVQEGMLRLIKR
jgi:acyl-CoA thioesterase-2